MAASGPSKRSKVTTSTDKRDNDDTESVLSVADVSSEARVKGPTLCVVCGKKAVGDIVKNSDFVSMMQLYYMTFALDVKPDICRKDDLCLKCFDEIIKLYETNDVIVYFENLFKSMSLNIIRKTVEGIKAREEADQPLTRMQVDIKKDYGNKTDVSSIDEKLIEQTLSGYKAECHFEETEDTDNGEEVKRKKIKLVRKEASGAASEEALAAKDDKPGKNVKTSKKPTASIKISLRGVGAKRKEESTDSSEDSDTTAVV